RERASAFALGWRHGCGADGRRTGRNLMPEAGECNQTKPNHVDHIDQEDSCEHIDCRREPFGRSFQRIAIKDAPAERFFHVQRPALPLRSSLPSVLNRTNLNNHKFDRTEWLTAPVAHRYCSRNPVRAYARCGWPPMVVDPGRLTESLRQLCIETRF